MSVIAGRSKVATSYGIVVASQPLAARAGVQILERGAVVSDMLAALRQAWTLKFQADPRAVATYLINGRAPGAGEVFKSRALAASLRLIAENGPAGFYEGPMADAILATSREHGGA